MANFDRRLYLKRNQFILKIIVSNETVAHVDGYSRDGKYFECLALVDTGAGTSSISNELAEMLDLRFGDQIRVLTASHSDAVAYQYHVKFWLPAINRIALGYTDGQIQHFALGEHAKNNTLVAKPLLVQTSPVIHDSQGIDAVIGMDVLLQGKLVIEKNKMIFQLK